jgi:hypothetical protein
MFNETLSVTVTKLIECTYCNSPQRTSRVSCSQCGGPLSEYPIASWTEDLYRVFRRSRVDSFIFGGIRRHLIEPLMLAPGDYLLCGNTLARFDRDGALVDTITLEFEAEKLNPKS